MIYPTAKLPFEELTSIDERVDYVHNQLVDAQLALDKLLEKEAPSMITKGVSLAVTAQPLQGVKIPKYSPLRGRITQIIPHWPAGCEDPATGIPLVDIAFGHADTWVYPGEIDTFLALNDVTPVINVSEPVTKGEELWIDVRNGDAVNSHSVSLTLTIVGVAKE